MLKKERIVKVLDFNCMHLVKDEFSEIDNQQQNTIKMGGIRWLKLALHVHVLQDICLVHLILPGFLYWYTWLRSISLLGMRNNNTCQQQYIMARHMSSYTCCNSPFGNKFYIFTMLMIFKLKGTPWIFLWFQL